MIQRYRVFTDQDSFHQAGCAYIRRAFRDAIWDHGSFHIVLAGGSTPVGLYRTLTEQKWTQAINWRRVHFWWGDERLLPPDHEDSNYNIAWKTLLSFVTCREKRIHRIQGESETAAEAACLYEEDIRKVFRKQKELPCFDLVLLGVGADGHTASLFPGNDMNRESKLVLDVPQTDVKPSVPRITLSLDVINNANAVLFLAGTRGKRRILSSLLKSSLHGERDSRYPASLVQPRKECVWHILDETGTDIRI